MLTFIGVLLLIIGVALFVLPKVNKELNFFSATIKRSISIIGIIMILLGQIMVYSSAGYSYLVVSPFGNKTAIMDEGYKFVLPFSKIYAWQKYIDIIATDKELSEEKKAEIEGLMPSIDIRFIDQVTAKVSTAIRIELPKDPNVFIGLAVKYRSMVNLVENTLIPTISEQIINTGYMFSGQNYISGEAQQFRTTFDEQLKRGTYAVVKEEDKDTTFTEEIDIINGKRAIKEITITRHVSKKLDVNGIPIRIPHELTENNIIVSQVIVDDIVLDPSFQKRLEQQKMESALRQLEQQKIETAKMTQSRVIAEGESEKAQERVDQEKIQVKELIAIETKLKQERTNKELAEIQLQTEKILAQKQKISADAKRYEIQQANGLSEQRKFELEIERDTRIGVAREIKDLILPTTMIVGGSNGSSDGGLNDILKSAMVKQLIEPTKK